MMNKHSLKEKADIETPLLGFTHQESLDHPDEVRPSINTTNHRMLLAAILLVACGSASEGAQAMFAECTTFNYSDFIATLSLKNTPLESCYLSLIILGAAATAIQSACLESTNIFEFLKNPWRLIATSEEVCLKLTLGQQMLLAATIFLGALVRGAIAVMGYYAIYGNLSTTTLSLLCISAAIDVLLTAATDGMYLKDNYLWARCEKNNSQSRESLTKLCHQELGENNPTLETVGSQRVFNSALFFGTLAISGEVGLAALALKELVSKWQLTGNITADAFSYLSLGGFFALLTASDTMTCAKAMAVYWENPNSQSTETVTSKPCCSTFTTGMAACISIAGAMVRAIGTYSGTLHLAKLITLDTTDAGVIAAGAIFGAIRAGQCVALEGGATIRASQSMHAWFKPSYQALPNDDSGNNTSSYSLLTRGMSGDGVSLSPTSQS